MKIESLNLSGFKNFDLNTRINFRDEHSNFIFDSEAEMKHFLFEIILGVLFGFNQHEKELFKTNEAACNVYTGMLTLEFDQKTLLIERDFETDFVASIFIDNLKTGKHKPFFQGKDFVHPDADRPFLLTLKNYFELCDKSTIRTICSEQTGADNRNLSELLDILYLLLAPDRRMAKTRKSLDNISPTLHTLNHPGEDAPEEEQLDFLTWIQASLIDLLKINIRTEQLVQDISIMDRLIDRTQTLSKQYEALLQDWTRKYSELQHRDAFKLRSDVLFWRKRTESKIRKEIQLKNVKTRIKKIEDQIHFSYSVYDNVHKTYEEDIERYQGLKSELVLRKGLIEEHQKNLNLKQRQLRSRQKKKWFVLLPVPIVTFVISFYIFGNAWGLLIPETILVIATLVLYFGLSNKSISDKIFSLSEEHRKLEHRKKEINKEVKILFRSSQLFNDEEYLINHLEHINTYHHLQKELSVLKNQHELLVTVLSSAEYTEQLTEFTTEFGQLLTMGDEFLNDFANAQQQLNDLSIKIKTFPEPDKLVALREEFQMSLETLYALKEDIAVTISLDETPIDDLLDQTTRKIKNLEMELELQRKLSKASA